MATRVVETLTPVDPVTIEVRACPPVPSGGDNEDLLAWAMTCAAANREMVKKASALQPHVKN